MFDFFRWRDWLNGAASELKDAGFTAEWKSHDKYLPVTSIEATGMNRIGSFRSFENGLVDYEIFDLRTGKFIANETMIQVDDQNFTEVFRTFSETLKKSI